MSNNKRKRRKQTVIPFERNQDVVLVDIENINYVTGYHGVDALGVADFLKNLRSCKELRQQINTTHEFKSHVKTLLSFSSDTIALDDYSMSVSMLLLLYLEPATLALRKSLEWITDTLIQNNSFPLANIRGVIQRICLTVIRRVGGLLDSGSVDVCMGWAYTFTCIALLDKECIVMDDVTEDVAGTSNQASLANFEAIGDGMLSEFMVAVLLVFESCARMLAPGIASADDDSRVTETVPCQQLIETSAEVMRYAECCGECMRSVMIVLKIRRDLVVVDDNKCCWVDVIRSYMACGCTVLSSELVNKDVLTATALGLMYLQWLSRFLSCWGGFHNALAPSLQAVAILGLTDCTERPNYVPVVSANELYDFAISSGLHEYLCSYTFGFSVIGRFALCRAMLHVYDDSSLLYVPSCYAVQGIERHVLASNILKRFSDPAPVTASIRVPPQKLSLVLTSIFQAVLAMCNHSLPSARLYGLQTMEAWFARIELLESVSASLSLCFPLSASNVKAAATTSTLDSWFDRSASDYLATNRKARGGGGGGGVDERSQSMDSEEMFSNTPRPDPLPLPIDVLTLRLGAVSSLLSRAWSHPSKRVNHMVPAIYQRLVDCAKIVDNRIQPGKDRDVWEPLVTDALSQPPTHRGRYQALSILLPKVGPHRLLQSQPEVIMSLVQAMKVRDVASSSCIFAGNLLRELQPTMDKESFRKLWVVPFVSAICSTDLKMRCNATDYLVPEMLALDPSCGSYLIDTIRSFGIGPDWTGDKVLAGTDDREWLLQLRLWGIINIVLQARLLAVPGREVTPPTTPEIVTLVMSQSWMGAGGEVIVWPKPAASASMQAVGPLQTYELCWACMSNDEITRLLALTLLTASQRTIARMESHELGILKATLRYSLKTPLADHRHRVMRLMKTLFVRLKETSRVYSKDTKGSKYGPGAAAAGTGQPSTPPVDPNREAMDVCEWLGELCLDNIYPGSPFDREVITLELLQCAIEGLGQISNFIQPLFSASMTASIINLFMSSWDRSRRLAADILLKFPRPLPGFESPSAVSALVAWGCRLTASGKQREADAGALLMRLLLVVYSMHLGWDIEVSGRGGAASDNTANNDVPKGSGGSVTNSTAQVKVHSTSRLVASAQGGMLIGGLCDLLADRLAELKTFLASCAMGGNEGALPEPLAAGETETEVSKAAPMCHGLVLALRYCLEEADAAGLWKDSSGDKGSKDKATDIGQWTAMRELWELRVHRVLRLALQGFKLALTVVAEDDSREKPPYPSAIDGSDTRGPVNTNSYMFVNTNGYMEGEVGEDQGTAVQTAIVASWLLLKESAALLARLVIMCPPVVHASSDGQLSGAPQASGGPDPLASSMLGVEAIASIGSTLLDSLGRLRHMGAIAETHASLQLISECLLRYGERSSDLCRLPSVWLQQSLDRLREDQQSFILRRSAGFAYSFVALLRSEPGNIKPSLLPEAMRVLLELADGTLGPAGDVSTTSVAVEGEGKAVDAVGEKSEVTEQQIVQDDEPGGRWKTSVHALNIIRLILMDGALGQDLNAYIAHATILAMNGFRSPIWAVRNSSMMVFSAVVQRAVDNDKNDATNVRCTTAFEFFHCFPALFPFFLAELASIVDFEVTFDSHGWPNGVIERDLAQRLQRAQSYDPGTHPSLYPLLLILSKLRASMVGAAPTREEAGEDREGQSENHHQHADLTLFLPLLASCSGQRVHKVREIAAKAIAALVPLREAPMKVSSLLLQLSQSFSAMAAEDRRRLPYNQIHGLLLQSHELLKGLSKIALSGDHPGFIDESRSDLQLYVLPLLQALLTQIVDTACPPILLVYFRLLQDVIVVCPCLLAWCLLGSVCEAALADALVIKKRVVSVHTPCAPSLWKETLREIVPMVVKIVLGHFREDSATTSNGVSQSPPSAPVPPTTISLSSLLALLWHPVSEVREGVLSGCTRVLEQHKEAGDLLLQEGLIRCLLVRIQGEVEPPLLQKTMVLLGQLTRIVPFSTLDKSCSGLFRGAWPRLHRMATGVHTSSEKKEPEQPLDFADSLDLALDAGAGTRNVHLSSASSANVAPTWSAASAIEVMGWMVVSTVGPDAMPIESPGETDRPSGAGAGFFMRDWVSLLEGAAAVGQTATVRESAARALGSSGLLGTYARKAAVSVQTLLSGGGDALKGQELASELGCRLWLLALHLMQDDDEDVRDLCGAAVTTACASVASHMSEDLQKSVSGASVSSCFSAPTPVAVSPPQISSSGQIGSPGFLWMVESMSVPPGFRLQQIRAMECMAPALALVMAWSAAGADPSSQGWGSGARSMMKQLHYLGGRPEDVTALLSTPDGGLAGKIFETEQDNLHSERVVDACVLCAAVGTCVTLLSEPQAGLVWRPLLKRADLAIEFLDIALTRRVSEAHQAEGLPRLGGLCFHPDFFCFVFCALRAACEIARAGRPSLPMFQALRSTQRKASEFLTELNKRTRDKTSTVALIHPKVQQLVVFLGTSDE